MMCKSLFLAKTARSLFLSLGPRATAAKTSWMRGRQWESRGRRGQIISPTCSERSPQMPGKTGSAAGHPSREAKCPPGKIDLRRQWVWLLPLRLLEVSEAGFPPDISARLLLMISNSFKKARSTSYPPGAQMLWPWTLPRVVD